MGETILGNRYEIIRKIGDGGMAFVYEAKDRLLNRIVAVKVLRPEFVDDEEFLAKFKREAEAVANISHPNIVNVYDVGCDGRVNYIVMEYIDGQNLKEIIKSEGTLDEYTALDITKQIAKALGAAHKKGVIHRDIKPHNILISSEGRDVKVADFGIAKAATNSTMTNIGSIIGSVHYFSPEQAKGKSVKNNADLYSLGIVLYEMLLGKVPFKGDSPISIALQHINEDIEFSLEEKTQIPQSIRTLIKKLTEKDPFDRYQSSEEVIEDIEYIEQNIDLDFIKQYDDFATRKTSTVDIMENSNKFNTMSKDLRKEIKEEVFDEPEREVSNNYEMKFKKKKKKRFKGPLTGLIVIGLLVLTGIITNGFGLLDSNEEDKEISVPNLVNMSFENANKLINSLELKPVILEKYDSQVEKGYVISQTPQEGTMLKKGDTVTIVISLGQEGLSVPDIVGKSLEEARKILEEKGLVLGDVTEVYDKKYGKGIIISQYPTSSLSDIKKGSTIDVVISKGQEPTVEDAPIVEEPASDEKVPPIQDNQDQNTNTNDNTNTGNTNNDQINNEQTNNSTTENNGDVPVENTDSTEQLSINDGTSTN